MRRLLSVIALAALSMACTPQNQLSQLPNAPTTTESSTAPTASAAPSAAPAGATLKPLAAGVKLTYEHKVSAGSTTVDTYDVKSVNDTSASVTLTRLYNGKEDIRGATKSLSRQETVLWPDFSRLAAGEFAGGYAEALPKAVDESVTVPAGTFMAKKLMMDGSRKRTYWISGTYLIKATTEQGTETTTTELQKIQ